MPEIFDFIIVGGGTAGPVLANRIANSVSKPKVLLLEAGGPNDDASLKSAEARFAAVMNPSMNWGYKSTPQSHLDDRRIDCYRGRGLGGCSAINFSCWLIGHKEDFNRWAALVGDDCWKWEGENGVKKRFKKIENLHALPETKQPAVLNPESLSTHSNNGMVDISYSQAWTEADLLTFQAAKQLGHPLNGDINSGDPTGWGVVPVTFHNGQRITAATAYLSNPTSNLTIVTDTVVTRVLFDGKTIVGVQTMSGQHFHASKEVILSAGTVDSPKVLLLSGIGPKDELAKLSIPLIHDLAGVGKNMKDHCMVTVPVQIHSEANASATPSVDSDPLQAMGQQVPMAWLSSPAAKSSKEFSALPKETQAFLQKVPSYELIATRFPPAKYNLSSDACVMNFAICVMNAASTGSITLASSNPSVAPNIDVNYLSHPYDRRVAIEGLRALVAFSHMPAFAAVTEKVIEGPDGDSEEELWAHAKKSVAPVFHFAGTCKMGREEDEMAVVDSDFKVRGVTGLRVVDHSIAPLMVNNHTQSTAYLIGETAAEKIIIEHRL